MNDRLQRLLELLDLNWTDEQLDAALLPFRLGNQLAEGSMALVFDGTSETGRIPVIMKLPSPAECLLRIEHDIHNKIEGLQYEGQWLETVERKPLEGVVRLVANRTNDPLPFLVVEKLGQALDVAIEENDDIPMDECLVMLRDVATALEVLHQRGLCHYDVKPGNVLRGHRSWTLIDPAAQDTHTSEYYERWVSGPARDVLALGRTFLAAYLGYEGEIDLPHGYGYDIEEHPTLCHFLRRMLGKTRYSIPLPTQVRRLASRILAEEHGIPSPHFPVTRPAVP